MRRIEWMDRMRRMEWMDRMRRMEWMGMDEKDGQEDIEKI